MRAAVLGLGLVGGSVAQALHTRCEVVGHDVAPQVRADAAAWGLAVADDVDAAVADADLVVLAAPVAANVALLARLRPGLLVTDVSGVKGPLVRAWSALPAPPALVPGHPMAGAEKAGWAAARPDLFSGARWVLSPGPWASAEQWLALCELVLDLGAQVVPSAPDRHDEAVALISHAPHLVAAVLGAAADAPLARSLAAGSFRDLTRITASPPERTADFCVANRTATARALRAAADRLGAAAGLLEDDDVDGVVALLGAGHDARGRFEAAHADLAAGVLEVDLDDAAWAEPLLRLADDGGVVVGTDRVGTSARLEVRRPA